ncbi:MAG TPA: pitrilysin family protein [Myxococcales bacterium]|nr:pitrilysin family protein [Myxococcales bacterium]
MTAPDVELPPLQIEKLPSGLTLLAIQKRGLPLFHVRLSLPAGACEDPRGKAGLAQFTVDLLRRGTRRRPAHDVDDLIESMGAQLYADVSMEEAALALTVPAELSERALDALLEVALEPAFEESEVAAARRRTIAGLQSDLDEPSTVAGRAVVSLGYAPGHPYAHPSQGFRRDVETFQREDALSFHATRYQQQGGLLAVVGQATPRELLEQLQRKLAHWESSWPGRSQRSALQFAALPPSEEMRAVIIHKPDATQAQVRIVSPGLPRSTPRYAEAVVSNTALGGGFTSLLVDAIRVDRGLSYSVSTRLHMNRRAGLSVFSSFTKNETLRELVDLALEKMRAYAASGPSEDALEKARRYLAGLFPLGLESHEALAEQVADALLDGLGLDHLRTYRSRVLAVTAAQARTMAAELSPARDGALLTVVGESDAARRALNGLCPVDVRQLEEFA